METVEITLRLTNEDLANLRDILVDFEVANGYLNDFADDTMLATCQTVKNQLGTEV